MEKERVLKRRKGSVLVWIQLLLSVVLMMILGIIDILPMNYMIVIMAILWILFFFSWKLCRSRRSRVGGRALALLMILVLGVGSFYLAKTYSVLKQIADADVWNSDKDPAEEFFTVYISGNDMYGEMV